MLESQQLTKHLSRSDAHRSGLTLTMVCELRQTLRDGRARVALIALLALFATTLAAGWAQQSRYDNDVRAAASADRRIWEQQGARNPHSVAHFGQYAFKPAGALTLFDPGMTPWLGTALWMEAHYQNTAAFRSREDQTAPPIISNLSAAFVLQYLAPLLLIFLGYALVARERERQTLKLALANGTSLHAWTGGKLLALVVIAGILWLPSWLLMLVAETPDDRLRSLSLVAVYGVYLLMLCALVIAVSAWARTARGALLALLCGWVLMALVIPRGAAVIAERVAPSADAAQFWRDVRTAMRQGVGGHDPSDAREKALLERTLAEYGVTREEDLPVSFAGIALQAGEEHGNEVFDHFYDQLQAAERRQRMVLRVASLLSPWIAVRGLSSGIAGTDTDHHTHYTRAAEEYRRELQRYLNADMTRHAKGKDFDYQSDPDLWRQTPAFSYQTPALKQTGVAYLPDALLLLGWMGAALGILSLAVRKLAREGALS
jgi:ABC-2 type transport system permease protein